MYAFRSRMPLHAHALASNLLNLPPPTLPGPLLDEKEKARLAELMRFRGRVPDVTPEDRAEAARHRGAASKPRTRREELQRMFDAVSDEVEERRTFLQEMEALGALTRDHVHQVDGGYGGSRV